MHGVNSAPAVWSGTKFVHAFPVLASGIHIVNNLDLLYTFTSVNTNISSCTRDESKTSSPLQE